MINSDLSTGVPVRNPFIAPGILNSSSAGSSGSLEATTSLETEKILGVFSDRVRGSGCGNRYAQEAFDRNNVIESAPLEGSQEIIHFIEPVNTPKNQSSEHTHSRSSSGREHDPGLFFRPSSTDSSYQSNREEKTLARHALGPNGEYCLAVGSQFLSENNSAAESRVSSRELFSTGNESYETTPCVSPPPRNQGEEVSAGEQNPASFILQVARQFFSPDNSGVREGGAPYSDTDRESEYSESQTSYSGSQSSYTETESSERSASVSSD